MYESTVVWADTDDADQAYSVLGSLCEAGVENNNPCDFIARAFSILSGTCEYIHIVFIVNDVITIVIVVPIDVIIVLVVIIIFDDDLFIVFVVVIIIVAPLSSCASSASISFFPLLFGLRFIIITIIVIFPSEVITIITTVIHTTQHTKG